MNNNLGIIKYAATVVEQPGASDEAAERKKKTEKRRLLLRALKGAAKGSIAGGVIGGLTSGYRSPDGNWTEADTRANNASLGKGLLGGGALGGFAGGALGYGTGKIRQAFGLDPLLDTVKAASAFSQLALTS